MALDFCSRTGRYPQSSVIPALSLTTGRTSVVVQESTKNSCWSLRSIASGPRCKPGGTERGKSNCGMEAGEGLRLTVHKTATRSKTAGSPTP